MEIKSQKIIEELPGVNFSEFKEKTKNNDYYSIDPSDPSSYVAFEFYCFYPQMVRIVKFIDFFNLIVGKDVSLVRCLSEEIGISVDLSKTSFKIKEYYPFIKNVFSGKGVEIKNCQHNHPNGHPDFEIIKDETKFYVELKNENDTIRPNQLAYCCENPDKEIWFLFVKLGQNYKF